MSGRERAAIDYFYILSPHSISGFSIFLSVTKTLTSLFNMVFFVARFEKGSNVASSNCQMNETFFMKCANCKCI